MKKTIIFSIAMLCLIVLFAGCQPDNNQQDNNNSEQTESVIDNESTATTQEEILADYIENNSDKHVLDYASAPADSLIQMVIVFRNLNNNSESCIEFIMKDGTISIPIDFADEEHSRKYLDTDGIEFISEDIVKFALIDMLDNSIYDTQLQFNIDGIEHQFKVVSSEKRLE